MFAQARKTESLSKGKNPKQDIIDAAGDLDGIEVMNNNILVGIYIRPEKTAGGIIRPQSNVQEDEFQGKVALVLKKGPLTFDARFEGQNVEVGDWVVFRVNEGWHLTLNGTPCRLIKDENIRLKLSNPELVF